MTPMLGPALSQERGTGLLWLGAMRVSSKIARAWFLVAVQARRGRLSMQGSRRWWVRSSGCESHKRRHYEAMITTWMARCLGVRPRNGPRFCFTWALSRNVTACGARIRTFTNVMICSQLLQISFMFTWITPLFHLHSPIISGVETLHRREPDEHGFKTRSLEVQGFSVVLKLFT